MKGFKSLLMIFALCIFIPLTACDIKIQKSTNSSSSIDSSPSKYNDDIIELNIDETKELSVEDTTALSTLSLEIKTADIKIIPKDRDTIKAHFWGTIKSDNENDEQSLVFETSKETLEIKTKAKEYISYHSYYSSSLYLEIFVPKDLINSISAASGVGDIEINDMNLNTLSVALGTGSIKLKNITGDVTLTSGVGDVEIEYSQFNNNNNVSVNTGTGEISLQLSKDAQFNLLAKSGVGDINCYFSLDSEVKKRTSLKGKVGDSENKITLTSGVGNINVKK